MAWSVAEIAALILVVKDLGIHLSQSICRKLDLGQSIDEDVDYLYLVCDMVFALENVASTVYTDADYSLLAEMTNRLAVQRNRWRGL